MTKKSEFHEYKVILFGLYLQSFLAVFNFLSGLTLMLKAPDPSLLLLSLLIIFVSLFALCEFKKKSFKGWYLALIISLSNLVFVLLAITLFIYAPVVLVLSLGIIAWWGLISYGALFLNLIPGLVNSILQSWILIRYIFSNEIKITFGLKSTKKCKFLNFFPLTNTHLLLLLTVIIVSPILLSFYYLVSLSYFPTHLVGEEIWNSWMWQ